MTSPCLLNQRGDMQILLDEVKKFEAWNGLKVNRKKTCALITEKRNDTTLRHGRLFYNGSTIGVLKREEAFRYLGL